MAHRQPSRAPTVVVHVQPCTCSRTPNNKCCPLCVCWHGLAMEALHVHSYLSSVCVTACAFYTVLAASGVVYTDGEHSCRYGRLRPSDALAGVHTGTALKPSDYAHKSCLPLATTCTRPVQNGASPCPNPACARRAHSKRFRSRGVAHTGRIAWSSVAFSRSNSSSVIKPSSRHARNSFRWTRSPPAPPDAALDGAPPAAAPDEPVAEDTSPPPSPKGGELPAAGAVGV